VLRRSKRTEREIRRSRNDKETEREIRQLQIEGKVYAPYAPMYSSIRARPVQSSPASPDIVMLRGLGGEEKK
jgi:hypothetical protein